MTTATRSLGAPNWRRSTFRGTDSQLYRRGCDSKQVISGTRPSACRQPLGWLHEIPQELADFGILIHSGLCVRRAVLLNLTSASVAQPFSLLAGSVAQETVTTSLGSAHGGRFCLSRCGGLDPGIAARARPARFGCPNDSHRTGHCAYG